ncbi:MAG TPA: type IV pilus assembly protein PilM [Gaiellaceae bacterium]|nr:type IV pilus assembly protein PilM [Gaiellaceae bacterium]
MDDQSLWKKELSFGRKPKEGKDTDDSAATDDTPADTPVTSEPVAEETVSEEPSAKEPEVAEGPVWKKEVSFGPKMSFGRETSSREQPVEAEPVHVEATAPHEDLSDSEPEPADEAEVWKKEVSFRRKPEAAEQAAAEQLEEPVPAPDDLSDAAPEPVAEEKVWKKEVSFNRKPGVEPVLDKPADDPPVAEEEPVTAEPVVAEEAVAVEEHVVEEPGVETMASAVEAEPWNAPPSLPPAPVAEAPIEIVPASTPSADVDAPVTVAELPSVVADAPKVPFWKKELSLGGKKKRDRSEEAPTEIVLAPTPSVDIHSPVAAADLPSLLADTPKVPFWKKELGKKGDKTDKVVKDRKEKSPKVKAERAPKNKEPKQPKERKQKATKVKAERGSSKGRIVGLKIGASQLAAARVANNGSAELLQVAREPLAAGIVVGGELRDPDALAEALKDFFEKHGLPKKGVRLGIANNRIGVRTFEIAGIDDEKQLANAIRFRAQETLPIPIDEAVLDYQVLGEGVGEDGQPTKRVLLVVAYRELIDRYVDACKKAGITLTGIDLEAFALLRALQAPQDGVGTDATAALVVVAIGHERSTFAVSDGRVCEFTRVLEWGGSALNVAIARSVDAAPSEVEGTKRALSLMDEMVPEGITADQAKAAREAMRRAIQTFARELVSSLQYYQNQPGSLGIGEIVLTGGTAHLPGLAGELERLIGVHVRVGDPLARMKVSKKVGAPEQIGSLAVAIGLGIED